MAAKWVSVHRFSSATVGFLDLRIWEFVSCDGFAWDAGVIGGRRGKQGTSPTLEAAKSAAENAAREIAREILRELGDEQ